MNKPTFQITSFGEILYDVYPGYKKLGGAPLNFIYHIKKLTGNGNLISKVGSDEDGKEILTFLKKAGFDNSYIQIDELHPTGRVDVKLDANKIPSFHIVSGCAYEFIEYDENIGPIFQEKEHLFYFGTLAEKGEKTKSTLYKFLKMESLYFCDLNFRENFYTEEIIKNSLSKSNLVKLNLDELKIVNAIILNSEFDILLSSRQLFDLFNLDMLCVTLGDRGSLIMNQHEHCFYKSNSKNIIDTVGAGDAFSAILCLGYLLKWKMKKINKTASEFASAICSIKGALPEEDDFYNSYKEIINYE